jgi:dTDP-4-amino-4,6-dideoxygalactose transaminase
MQNMLLNRLVKSGRHQLKIFYKLVRGYPLNTPPLSSATLDIDDVQIATQLLNNRNDWYRDQECYEYNNQFSTWNGSKYAFSFMGGRVALSAIIHALDLKPDDEVIVPGYTCVVVANAFKYARVNVVYSDIELDTFALDIDKIKENITSKTKAILVQHTYGLLSKNLMDILQIAEKYSLYVIEDCAHSTGVVYQNSKVGNFGHAAFYSSERTKVFSTVKGGIAATNNEEIAYKLRQYYEDAPYPDESEIENILYSVKVGYYQNKHPQRWWRGDFFALRYWDKEIISTPKNEEKGIRPSNYGCKMPAALAALGLNQIKKLDLYNRQRQIVAIKWDRWCLENKYKPAVVVPGSKPIFLRYPILVEPIRKRKRNWALKDPGVEIGVWFVSNLHPIPSHLPNCPNANYAVQCCINFPTLLG